jgi:hypothetical protein
MLTLPLYSLLIIYGLFLLAFLFFFFTNVAHIFSTGSLTFASFMVMLFIIIATIATLWLTWLFLSGADWTQGITIFNKNWFGSGTLQNQIY